MSSFWWNFHHWQHQKLSKWQLLGQPVMKISSKWWHFSFNVHQYSNSHYKDKVVSKCCTTVHIQCLAVTYPQIHARHHKAPPHGWGSWCVHEFKAQRTLLRDGLTLIPIWVSNHMHSKVWDEITYPFPNLNSCTIEVWERISNFTPHNIMDVITYPMIQAGIEVKPY